MSRLLLVLHTVLAFALLGGATHLVIVSVQLLRGRERLRLVRLYARVVGWMYLGTLGVGMVLYPAYRYLVAGLYLNRHAPWASNLFDFKESLAALAVPLAFGLLWLARHVERRDRPVRAAFALCAIGVHVAVAVATVAGLIVTAERGV